MPNGRTTLTVKGRYEWDPRQPGKSPLCEGKVALEEAKQVPPPEKVHFLSGNCYEGLQITNLDADTLARLKRALDFVSTNSCPLGQLPF